MTLFSRKAPIQLMVIWASSIASASIRQSTDYALQHETWHGNGGTITSASYHASSAAEPASGIATNATAQLALRHGFIGQLYDPVALTLDAAPGALNEGEALQATAMVTADDATVFIPEAADIAWSTDGWPLAVDSNGRITTSAIYADTSGVLRASVASFSAASTLTVREQVEDNFGLYAKDLLDDSWQVTWFGLDNPNAAPTIDHDNDTQNNAFEYHTGTDPTDAASRFEFWITSVDGEPHQQALNVSPVAPGRTYTLQSRASLSEGTWAVTPHTVIDTEHQRTLMDTNAIAQKGYYRVQVHYP